MSCPDSAPETRKTPPNPLKALWTLLLYGLLALSLNGCSAVVATHYSAPEDNKSFNGYLIRGAGPLRSIPFALDNVGQIETADYVIAARINNHSYSYLTMGPLCFPLFPLFGIPGTGYDGKIAGDAPGVEVSIAILLKKGEGFSFEPCRIGIVLPDKPQMEPVSYRFSYGKDQRTQRQCGTADHAAPIAAQEAFPDVLLIDLTFKEPLYPQDGVKIVLPEIRLPAKNLVLPPFRFRSERGLLWTEY